MCVAYKCSSDVSNFTAKSNRTGRSHVSAINRRETLPIK